MNKITKLKLMRFLSYVDNVVDSAPKTLEALMSLREKPSLLNVASICVSALGVTANLVVDNLQPCNDKNWIPLFESCDTLTMRSIVVNILKKHHTHTVIKSSSFVSYTNIFEYIHIDGIMIGWQSHDEEIDTISKLMCSSDETTDIKNRGESIIRDLIWGSFNTCALVLERDSKNKSICLQSWERNQSIIKTPLMTDIMFRMEKFLAAGVVRTFAFVGEPGTGKSESAAFIVSQLSLRCLKIPINIMSENFADIGEVIRVIGPDVVLIDDIDWCTSGSALLFDLEAIRKITKLVVLTMNSAERMTAAMKRPGRIDEMIVVDRLSNDVIKLIVDDDDDKNIILFESWPAAFISEYKIIKDVFGQDCADAAIKELSERLIVQRGPLHNDAM